MALGGPGMKVKPEEAAAKSLIYRIFAGKMRSTVRNSESHSAQLQHTSCTAHLDLSSYGPICGSQFQWQSGQQQQHELERSSLSCGGFPAAGEVHGVRLPELPQRPLPGRQPGDQPSQQRGARSAGAVFFWL